MRGRPHHDRHGQTRAVRDGSGHRAYVEQCELRERGRRPHTGGRNEGYEDDADREGDAAARRARLRVRAGRGAARGPRDPRLVHLHEGDRPGRHAEQRPGHRGVRRTGHRTRREGLPRLVGRRAHRVLRTGGRRDARLHPGAGPRGHLAHRARPVHSGARGPPVRADRHAHVRRAGSDASPGVPALARQGPGPCLVPRGLPPPLVVLGRQAHARRDRGARARGGPGLHQLVRPQHALVARPLGRPGGRRPAHHAGRGDHDP